MPLKLLSPLILSALMAVSAYGQPGLKDPEKPGEPEWPKQINEKTLKQWLDVVLREKDPSLREQALQTIPRFDPREVRKLCATPLIEKLEKGEPDTFLKVMLIDLIGSMGIEDVKESKEAVRVIGAFATSPQGSVFRLHALQALAKFGHRAYPVSRELTQNEAYYNDPSFEVRRTLAQTFVSIGSSDSTGPSPAVLNNLASHLAKDGCLPVRLEALKALYFLGPPWDQSKLDVKPRAYNEKDAEGIANIIKLRVRGTKTTKPPEDNPQAQMWCHLVIMRFAKQEKAEFDEQLNGIAAFLNDDRAAVRFQCLELLGVLGEFAEPKKARMIELLKDPLVRSAAALALCKMGDKIEDQAFEGVMAIITDPTLDTGARIEALSALAFQGERAERGRERIMTIVMDPANLKAASGVALLQQALLTLSAMGVKAKPTIAALEQLKLRVEQEKIARMNSPEYLNMLKNKDFQKMLTQMDEKQRKQLFDNQAEDQLRGFIDQTIHYIQESAPGRPGPAPPETKKP